MAEQTFKVGDKVRAFGTRAGVVTYGPIASTFSRHTLYAVKETVSGNEVAHHVGDLRAAPVVPAFAVGDTVTLTTRPGLRATVEYGPFDSPNMRGSDVYVVKLMDPPVDDNPRTFTALANVMEKVETRVPVGTRVRVDRARWVEEFHGSVGTVTSNDGDFRADVDDVHVYRVEMDNGIGFYAAEVTPVADEPPTGFEYNGTVYEYGVKYVDRDGDYFEFDAEIYEGDDTRTPRGRYRDTYSYHFGGWDWSLAEVVNCYGPLTKVTA